MDAFIGEIRIFAGTYAPMDWALCQGQIIPVNQNPALFSILGATYGGDGQTTFALPNLQARVPIGQGSGPNLTPRPLGRTGGGRSVTLTGTQSPAHNHAVNCLTTAGGVASPAGAVWAATPSAAGRPGVAVYSPTANVSMKADIVPPFGNPTPMAHENQQPFLAMNFIICLSGEYPVRP